MKHCKPKSFDIIFLTNILNTLKNQIKTWGFFSNRNFFFLAISLRKSRDGFTPGSSTPYSTPGQGVG